MEKHSGNIGKTTYLNREKDFDGMIFFHNLEGKFVNGWRYEKGEVTGKVLELAGKIVITIGQEEAYRYEIMPMIYSVKNYCRTRSNDECTEGEIIDGGELDEVVVRGEMPGYPSGGGSIIINIHSINHKANPQLGVSTLDQAWKIYERTTQHQAIALREITNLANELERLHQKTDEYKRVWEYFTKKTLEDRKLFYKALAWEGLKDTKAYEVIDPVTKENMEKIHKEVIAVCLYSW